LENNNKKKKIKKGISVLRGKVRKIKLFGYDIETYDNNKSFLCGSIVGDGYCKTFYSKDEVKKEIQNNRIFRNSYICATNLMFDFFGTFDIVEAIKDFSIIERQGDVIMATTYIPYDINLKCFIHPVKKKEFMKLHKLESNDLYPVRFIDTANHLKTSVKNLGKIIGLEKMEAPECLGNKPSDDKEWNYMVRYNIRDAEISYKFMEFLQENYNMLGGNLKATISSTSMDMFRRRYLKRRWHSLDDDADKLCFKAYYGGRTEAFKRGLFNEYNYDKINVYDVNSLYPYCLRNFSYPDINSYTYKKKATTDDIYSYEGICYAEMRTNDMDIPVLPVKEDKLRFPTGYVKGYYDFNSLRLAVNEGYEILNTGEGVIFYNKFSPFTEMIDNLYKLRIKFKKEKNNAEIVVKLNMNSFYGKFAYRFFDKEYLTDINNLKYVKENDSIIPTPDKRIYRVIQTDNRKPSYVFPIIPLYVTSYARMTMYRYFKKIGFDNVLYTDTDSVFTTKNIETSNSLGGMKLEKKFKELIIVKPKVYSGILDNGKCILKVKGIHRSIKDYEHFKNLIKKGFSVDVVNFRKLRSAIGRQDKWVNQVYKINKTLNLEDDKREWFDKFKLKVQESKPIYRKL